MFAPSVLFCNALRASRLRELTLTHANVWEDVDAGMALFEAVTGHTTLQSFFCDCDYSVRLEDEPVVSAALGRLVAANPLALTELVVNEWHTEECVLGPLIAALPTNTHLRVLNCANHHMPHFLAVRMLAAVRANTSLRRLNANDSNGSDDDIKHPELTTAEALVAAR